MSEPGRSLVIDLGRPRQRVLVTFFLVAGVIELALLVIGGLEAKDFSDSSNFCGALCHNVMDPEYVTQQASPHAKVACVRCHVGPGTNYLVQSKITGIPLVFATVFDTYDRPIESPVHNLRPARETCEKCHWPEKFTQDRVRVYETYAADEENTPERKLLVFRMGGGAVTEGVHWHIASKLWYLPLDEKRQEIGWVRVEGEDGSLTEYVDPERLADITPERIQSDARYFDCLDCHNRATHVFRSPDELLDAAIAKGDIDPSIPFIKREGLKVLDISSPSLEQARAKAESLPLFYRDSYPEVYQGRPEELRGAVETLKELAELAIFPEMRVTWQTHSNNLSHTGCDRCHGKLVRRGEVEAPAPIEASCALCHYQVPNTVAQVLLGAEVAPPPEPATIPHAVEGLQECLACHGTPSGDVPLVPDDHRGRANDTCPACHKAEPAVSPAPTPTPVKPVSTGTPTSAPAATPTPPVAARTGTPAATPVATPTPPAAPQTSTPVPTATAVPTPPAALGPATPHTLEGRSACLMCHGAGVLGAAKVPESHAGRTEDTCILCHSPR